MLNIFYVGGISRDVYNIEKLLKVMDSTQNTKLVVCCRENEWDKVKNEYSKYLKDKIEVVHSSGETLNEYYQQADICSLLFEKHEYRDIAMPMKLFEYISNRKPIIATIGTAAGDFVKENNIGWAIEYDEKSIFDLVNKIQKNRNQIKEKVENFDKVIELNTWEERAKKVAKDLT